MITTKHSARTRPLSLAPLVAAGCGLLLLTGCSSGTSNASPGDQPSAAQSGQNGQSGQGGQGGRGNRGGGFGANDPGRVTGEIAAIDGKTLQIQDGESQTAVTYSSGTTFLTRVTGKVSDISAGDCVTVFSSSTDEKATSVTATSVTASPAANGECELGFGGGGRGARPSGAPSGMPSAGGQPSAGGKPPSGAAPSGAPSGMPNNGARPRAGKVTAIKGDTLTLAATQLGSDDTTTLTVKTTSDTTVTVTKSAKASAAKVGMCANANGKADDTGTVAAKSITVYKSGDQGCGFRRANR